MISEDPGLVICGPGVAAHHLAVAEGGDDAGLRAEAGQGAVGVGHGALVIGPEVVGTAAHVDLLLLVEVGIWLAPVDRVPLGLRKVGQVPRVDPRPVHARVWADLLDSGSRWGEELVHVSPQTPEVRVDGPGDLPSLLPQLLLPPRVRLNLRIAEVWSNPAHNGNYSVNTRI